MTNHYALSAMKRERAGKGVARALRREDRIPAVIYGDNKTPVTISLPTKEINLEYLKGHMYTTLCDLEVEGQKNLVLARDVQLHPVTDRVIHVDFLRVTNNTKLTVAVPVHFIDREESPGLKEKGVLNVVRHTVELVCIATDIPEHLEVSLKGVEMGDAVKISKANMPKGAKPAITDRDFTIATIAAPRAILEEKPVEAEAAAGAAAEAKPDAAKPEEKKA